MTSPWHYHSAVRLCARSKHLGNRGHTLSFQAQERGTGCWDCIPTKNTRFRRKCICRHSHNFPLVRVKDSFSQDWTQKDLALSIDARIERTLIPIIFTFVAFHGHSMQFLTLKVPNSLYLKPLKRFHCQTGSQTVSPQLQFTKSILWFKFLLLKWTYQKHLKSNTILCFRKHAKWLLNGDW